MAFTHTLNLSWANAEGRALSTSKQYSGGAQASVSESIANSATDELVNFALDVSTIKAIFIKSDQDITLETNSGSVPDDTLTLLAGVPYIWHTGSYFTNLLTTDITTNIFITNSSGSAALLEIEVVTDPTP